MNHSLESSSDEALLRRVLVDVARDRDPLTEPNAHLDANTLVAYHEGSLGDDDARQARDHMVACATCAGLLTDLGAGFDERHGDADHENRADPTHTDTLDFERAATWRALRATVGANVPSGPSAAIDHERHPSLTTRSHRWVMALAALLLVTVAGLAWRVSELGREADGLRSRIAVLETPQDQVEIAYFDAITRDAEPVATVVTSATRPTFLLIVTPPLGQPGQTYQVEILGPSGDVHWSGDQLTVNDHGTLRIALSRPFMLPARYQVRLLDSNGEVIDDRVLWVTDG